MARVEVMGPMKDGSCLGVVGWFDSNDVEVFERAAPPPDPKCLLSRSEKQEASQQLLCTGDGRWVMRLDFGGAVGIEHRYVDPDVASAWLYRNGYTDSALESLIWRVRALASGLRLRVRDAR